MHTATVLKSALITVVAVALYLPLHAEVKMILTASKVVTMNGAERKEAAATAKPGDVIEYVTECKNEDKNGVKNFMPVLPVPKGMEYIPQTAAPEPVMASTDGVNFAPVPLKRSVRGADGKMADELVPYSQYRSLRWNLGDIAGGASKTIKARMKVKTAE